MTRMGTKNKSNEMASNNEVFITLQKYQQGSRKDFDSLLATLGNPELKGEQIISYLQQLKECISILGKDFEIAIGVILKIKWLDHEDVVCQEYQSFFINLLSAHTIYLKACLRMIVKYFAPNVTKSEEPVPQKTQQLHERQFIHLHGLLCNILKIVPMTPSILVPLLNDLFPFMTKSSYQHVAYQKNLLQITMYLPEQRGKILTIIVNKMAQIDVRAPRATIEATEDESDEDEIVFDMDDGGNGETLKKPEAEASLKPAQGPMRDDFADHLDVMMEVFFTYIHTLCHPNDTFDWAATKKLYLDLLTVFDKIILPTHALCHTQFLLFYICSFREELAIGFIDFLWKKVTSPSAAVIFRQTATSYIASFLARSKYITIGVVQSTLDVLAEYVHRYVTEAAHTSTRADLKHHSTFYAVCQALLYIIVFRHKELLGSRKGHKYIQGLNLQTIVTSRLNPLKFCFPIVVKTFSSVMRQHQLVFCDTIIEKNRRALPMVDSTGPDLKVNPLDSFFPFDPFVLSRSKRFVQEFYQEYEGSPAAEDEDGGDAQGDEEEMDKLMEQEMADTDVTMYGSTPVDLPLSPTTPTDFFMYGTSPGFKNI